MIGNQPSNNPYWCNFTNDEIVNNFYINVFKKILENFNICHIHVNNAENQTKIRGIKVPHLLEITYLRKDFYKSDFKDFGAFCVRNGFKNLPSDPKIVSLYLTHLATKDVKLSTIM